MVPERSIYVFASGLTTFLILFTWQPIAGVIWSFSSGPANWLLWSGFGLGQLFLLAALLALDPFELLGLRQVGLLPAREDTFKLSWLHRRVRHPIYTAVITGMAGIALRTRTPVAIGLAVALAGFLSLKATWEERHLRSGFPGYDEYARSTPMFLPLSPPRRYRGGQQTTLRPRRPLAVPGWMTLSSHPDSAGPC